MQSHVSVLAIVGLLAIEAAAAAHAGPANPFVGTAPWLDMPALEPTKYDVGESGGAEQRGAATYTLPLDVPPGRNGMAPSLVLRYSPLPPLCCGVAVGWTPDLPSISVDPSLGPEEGPIYKASLGTMSGQLVEVPDISVYGGKTYQADYDETFTRFERIDVLLPHVPEFRFSRAWPALTTNDTRHYFLQICSASDSISRWQITNQVDDHGNSIHHRWERVLSLSNFNDFAICSIE